MLSERLAALRVDDEKEVGTPNTAKTGTQLRNRRLLPSNMPHNRIVQEMTDKSNGRIQNTVMSRDLSSVRNTIISSIFYSQIVH